MRQQNYKENNGKRELFGCFFNRFQSLFHWRTFRGTLGNDSEFGCRRISASGKREIAFFAFPDANALAPDFHETALWALVFFLHADDYFGVAFADCGAVADS